MEEIATAPKGRSAAALFLFIAPAASMLLVQAMVNNNWLAPGDSAWGLALMMLAWVPLPFSIPAIVLQNHRDRFEAGGNGIARGIRMIVELSKPGSVCFTQMWASHLGLVIAAITAAGLLA